MTTKAIHCIEQPVKDELLDIYQAFAIVCNKYNLRHWMGYGTMLGAVRHNGFIPWDDDFDVFMLREDYEKFFSIADKELPTYFKPVTLYNCKAYPTTFGKIQESRREIYEKLEVEVGYVNPHGLYIDVFPLDAKPEGFFSAAIDALRQGMLFCRHSHIFRSGGHGKLKGRVAGLIGRLLYPLYHSLKTPNDFARWGDAIYKSILDTTSSRLRIGSFQARFQKRELSFPREAFDETDIVPFESITVPVPNGYDACLRSMYGNDYMTPPPLEKRVSEHSLLEKAPWYYGPDINLNP